MNGRKNGLPMDFSNEWHELMNLKRKLEIREFNKTLIS